MAAVLDSALNQAHSASSSRACNRRSSPSFEHLFDGHAEFQGFPAAGLLNGGKKQVYRSKKLAAVFGKITHATSEFLQRNRRYFSR